MENQLFTSLASIATAIIGVAILSVILSNKSNTANVINSASSGFAQDLATAVGPITGYTPSSGLLNIQNPTASGSFTL